MHARHIRFQADPDRIDASTRHTEEVLLPLLRDMDGFRGFVSFGDRSTGAGVAISAGSPRKQCAPPRKPSPGPARTLSTTQAPNRRRQSSTTKFSSRPDPPVHLNGQLRRPPALMGEVMRSAITIVPFAPP